MSSEMVTPEGCFSGDYAIMYNGPKEGSLFLGGVHAVLQRTQPDKIIQSLPYDSAMPLEALACEKTYVT
ncbi:hypothetical protein AVEN_185723-1 [Araneus ventricosus]|uniref:Uncharacterized protein n=1 Tax=Araneus ventricosus TaxID=182803 RepID=A0A4Y2TRN6_ARAVE|nr:hypothetical protein AVEN_185723-1 [Araneus ventricosus]